MANLSDELRLEDKYEMVLKLTVTQLELGAKIIIDPMCDSETRIKTMERLRDCLDDMIDLENRKMELGL